MKKVVNYKGEFETQLFRKVMVERSGFIPRSIQIQKMALQGELNKIINDFDNDRLNGRSTGDVPLSILSQKNLTRSEMIRLARNRYEEIKGVYFNDLSNVEKQQALLLSKTDTIIESSSSADDVKSE